MEYSKNSTRREVYAKQCLPKSQRAIWVYLSGTVYAYDAWNLGFCAQHLPDKGRQLSTTLLRYLKALEKQQQTKVQISKRKELVNTKAEINEVVKKKQKINKKKFLKTNEIVNPLAQLRKRRLIIRLKGIYYNWHHKKTKDP